MTKSRPYCCGYVSPGGRTALLVLAFGLLLLAQGWRAVRRYGTAPSTDSTTTSHVVHQLPPPAHEPLSGTHVGTLPNPQKNNPSTKLNP